MHVQPCVQSRCELGRFSRRQERDSPLFQPSRLRGASRRRCCRRKDRNRAQGGRQVRQGRRREARRRHSEEVRRLRRFPSVQEGEGLPCRRRDFRRLRRLGREARRAQRRRRLPLRDEEARHSQLRKGRSDCPQGRSLLVQSHRSRLARLRGDGSRVCRCIRPQDRRQKGDLPPVRLFRRGEDGRCCGRRCPRLSDLELRRRRADRGRREAQVSFREVSEDYGARRRLGQGNRA